MSHSNFYCKGTSLPGSPGSGISTEFCSSALATASISKFLEYEQMENGILWYFFQENMYKKVQITTLCTHWDASAL